MNVRQQQSGISLIELMVALTIGVVLIGGAFSVYINGRATYTLNETIARMQENANFALKYLERDIQLAGLWGTHTATGAIDGRATDVAATNNPIAGIPVDCGADWPIFLARYVEGSNNEPPVWDCIGDVNVDYVENSDALAVRRVEPTPVATADLQAGQVYIRTSLSPRGQLFLGNVEPGGFADDARNFELRAHAYYVSPNSLSSSDDVPVPALRRVELINGPAMRDTDIVPGVENFQVQFGVRPAADGTAPGAVVYVNPDSDLLDTARVVSVRIWVLVRSEQPETGYQDNATYTMGDLEFVPAANVRDHRRLLVTRTIDIRNRI
ncbi:MAG: PilW family protein [Gammaproteobacteria bacterium]